MGPMFWSTLCAAFLSMLSPLCYAQLVYAITIRDFLPVQCSLVSFPDNTPSDEVVMMGAVSTACPYKSLMDSGVILGHPDFNAGKATGYVPGDFYEANKINGNTGFLRPVNDAGETANTGNPTFEPTVLEYTTLAPSGLPKPQYCNGNSVVSDTGMVRCGVLRDDPPKFSTSNETYFNMWYNDDIKYNRRVGVELVLKPGNVHNEFKFDSAFDPENSFNPTRDNFYAPHGHLDLNETLFPDPLAVPMFPKERTLKELCSGRTNRLWHTTEIHTFFEYTKTEKFDFSGDDDVWVFINGRLAVDVAGVHGKISQFIDLGRDAAAKHFNMTVGGVYTFDMFQAERQCSGSNFKITTTLAAPCNAANEQNSKVQFDSTVDLTPEKARTSRTVVVHGDGSFLLTAAGLPHSTSYFWVKEPVNVGTGFVINFDFLITDITEGFAFVLHRRPEGLTNLPVSGGANLGFKGLTNSLAIVFDLCTDRRAPGTSCQGQRVSIHTPDAANGNNPSNRTLRVQDSVVLSLKNNEVHRVKLDYFAIPPALEVTIDGSLYLRLLPIDPIEVFQSRAAFAGFTGASGKFSNANVTISNFKVFAVDVESSATKTVDFPSDVTNFTRKYVLADGQEADGFSIQTFDGCDKLIEFGGREQNTRGIFVERADPITGVYSKGSLTPEILEAEIEDENTGRYKYTLRTLNEGRFALFLYYGNPGISCAFDFRNTTRSVGTGFNAVDVDIDFVGSSSCFFASIEDAIEMIPSTNAPTVSPTKLKEIVSVVDKTSSYVAGIGGGVVTVCAVIAAVFVVVYRRRWQMDKKFILEGRDYKREIQTMFDANDKQGMVGRELFASRAAILRLRARRGKEYLTLNRLETEQEELLEEVSLMKKKIEARSPNAFGEETIAPQELLQQKL